jgi:hypothetical protein
MYNIERQLERMRSPDKNIRYEARKQLRIAANLWREAIAALVQASQDPGPCVAGAARRALLAHRQHETQANTPPARLLCERCGRTIGEAILSCPDRQQGHCPYLLRDLMPPKTIRLISAVGLLFLILMLLLHRESEDQPLPLFVGVILCLIFLPALWGILGTSTLLYNPNSKLQWERTAFLGITLRRTLMPGGEQLSINLSFSRSLLFPPSYIKFSEAASEAALKGWTLDHAILVFRVALIGLLARRVVQIHKYSKYVAGWRGEFNRGQNLYVLTASEELDLAKIDGELERQIVLVLGSWLKPGGGELLKWPDGPTIYELVRAVFKKNVPSPERWPFHVVARDAVAHGWGRLEGWSRDRYQPVATHHVQLKSELAAIDELSSRLAKQQPAFSHALDDQIKRAIRSREWHDYSRY